MDRATISRTACLRAYLLALSALLWCVNGPAISEPSQLLALDSLVEQQRYDQVLRQLREASASDDEKLEWLRRHAEAGHVPLQYELAALVFSRDGTESLKWYARGRLARTLDAAECARQNASFSSRVALDNRAAAIRDAGVADPTAFNRAIEEALSWDANRPSSPSATWICGDEIQGTVSGLKRDPARLAARAEARNDMRIAAKSISDFERAVERGRQAHYKVVNSGISPAPWTRLWAAWIDDHRVLFRGYTDKGGDTEVAVFYWDVETNVVKIALQSPGIGLVCTYDSRVTITAIHHPQSFLIFEGIYPQLTYRKVQRTDTLISNMRQCRASSLPPSNPSDRIGIELLSDAHGYIELPTSRGRNNEYLHARLHRTDGTLVTLPMTAWGASVVDYAPWKGAYLLAGELRRPGDTVFRPPIGGGKRGDELVLFWLYPDGRTEEVTVPYGQWETRNRPSSKYRATKRGLVLSGGDSDSDESAGFSGLYLFEQAGEVTRLVAGPTEVGPVSPDGCRLLFAHAPVPAQWHYGVKNAHGETSLIDICDDN